MSQEVILNGNMHDLGGEPSLEVNTQRGRVPLELNGRAARGVSVNGFGYPPAESSQVLYLPGLPGQGSTIWDRSGAGNDGAITGAKWVRLPSGLWVQLFDGIDDTVDCGAIDYTAMSEFSFALWMYRNNVGIRHIAISAGYPCWQLDLWETNVIGFEFQVDDAYKYISSIGDIFSLPGQQWLYIGLSIKIDGTAVWSKNGTPIAKSGSFSGASFTGQRNTRLSMNGDLSYPMNGYIGLARVYSSYVSSAQHTRNYQLERHFFGV